MTNNFNGNGSCPVGYERCDHLAEIEHLRCECNRLLQLSITDQMTGYFNYRYLMSILDQEMERTRRTSLPTGLIMIDIDHFKHINDTYGHPTGDAVLKWVSDTWRRNIRRIDIPCRYGGEEFAIILPGTDLPCSVLLAERLRKVIMESSLMIEANRIAVTASFGVGAYKGTKHATAQILLDCADHMLIRAKVQGRNRVCSELEEYHRPASEVSSEEREALFDSRWEGTESPACLREFQEE